MASDEYEETNINYFRVLRICRLTKVMRISRFMSSYLQIFADMVILARHSFSMLMSLILFEITLLSAIIYSLEEDEGTFKSIFEAIYWCVITQTTVGYGDIEVVTVFGRLLSCFIAYTAIFNLIIMVNVMGSCFDEAYTRFLTKEEENFKMQLGLECDGNSWDVNRKSFKMKDNSQVYSPRELLVQVSKLNCSLSEIATTSETFSCDPQIVEQMKDVRDLLDKVICNDHFISINQISVVKE